MKGWLTDSFFSSRTTFWDKNGIISI